MTVRWTVRAATDRGPQAESRVLFGAPKKKHSRKSVGAFLLLSDTLLRFFWILNVVTTCHNIYFTYAHNIFLTNYVLYDILFKR